MARTRTKGAQSGKVQVSSATLETDQEAVEEANSGEEVDTELTREEFVDQWKHLCQEESGAFQDLDKTVLTLSTAVLSISIAFLAQVLKTVPVQPWLLYCAWACFVVSMCTTLISMMTSIYAIRRMRDIVTDIYYRMPSARQQPNRSARVTEWLTCLAASTLVCGMVALAFFAAVNVPH